MAESESLSPTTPATTAAPAAAPLSSSQLTSLDIWLIVLMAVWGANFVVLKAAFGVVTPFIFNTFRFVVGTAAIGARAKMAGIPLTLPRREWLPLITQSVLQFAIYQPFFALGLARTTVANNVLILATVPVWVVLINALRGQDRISRRVVIGTALALVGVLIVVLSRYAGQITINQETLIGDILSLIAAWINAVTILAAFKPLQRNPTIPASFWILAWGTLIQAGIAAPDFLRLDWSAIPPSLLIAVAYSGIISIGFGSVVWNRGVKELGASRAAIYTNLEPIVAAVAAILFLGESFTVWLVVGMILVIIGILFVKRA